MPESGAALGVELLREAAVGETIDASAPGAGVVPARIVAAVLAGGLLAALIAWLLTNSGAS